MGFDHRDPGTPEASWREAGVQDLPALGVEAMPAGATFIILAAHPDDEALGAPGLLARLRRSAHRVVVQLFTAGEQSHPGSPTHSTKELREIRLREFNAALDLFDHGCLSRRFVGLPDGQLSAFNQRIVDEIGAEVDQHQGPVVLVSPYSRDGHSDHEAIGAAALQLGRDRHTTVLEYPIWYWHWADPSDEEWRSWSFLPDPANFDRQAVFDCYPSQVSALSDQPGDEAIVGPAHLDHFRRGGDTFAVSDFRAAATPVSCGGGSSQTLHDASAASAVFDEVHVQRCDPWQVWSSEYEIAKRRNLLTHLPAVPYAHILEIGCSVGALTHELAGIGAQVTAVDASSQALRIARRRGAAPSSAINFVHATIPFEWPQGTFDCVVLSETGFYLSRSQLFDTLEKIDGSTTVRFILVLCHWRGEIDDWPLDADEVHRICLGAWPRHRVEHRYQGDYRLDIITIDKDFRPSAAEGHA
ncbi:bifunctional PIG-L family deacetylase/class I SAM-dependent methyltransferase [Brevibacterium sp. VCM10]|uniref:bifunctional PIG-L family deacetylase/class I SAM-dependent methyltransferase n=1 Tax=Brevibacterium sp. VCM10 TaxID=1381751 RepID=UPI000471C76A|nr:bifunctional PIG-L family deacetylase/class I SAM-dependent methyltransferase [Brevibacterium sp. VCM10]